MLQKVFLAVVCLFTLLHSISYGQEHVRENLDGFSPRNKEFHHESETQRERIQTESIDIVENFNVRFVGHWPFGPSYAVAVQGNYAYLGSGAGIYVLNISNPTSPERVADIKTRDTIEDLFVSGNFLYVSNNNEGLLIIDISNPFSPQQVGIFNTSGYANGIFVSDDYAYVADGSTGLQILDISDPTSPHYVGHYNTPEYAYDVVLSGNYAFIADYYSIQIINITDPTSPFFVGSYDTPGYALEVSVLGNFVYVADMNSGLQIINIANPASPYQTGSYETSDYAYGVSISENFAYVVIGYSGIEILNISNPSAPYLVASYDISGFSTYVSVSANYAYVAAGSAGLQVINISNPSSPYHAGSFETPADAIGITISGNYAFLANGYSGLFIININNTASPYLVGKYSSSGFVEKASVRGNYAFIVGYDLGLHIINISTPASPYFIASYEPHCYAHSIEIIGNYAYVACDGGGLEIINISNPQSPYLVGECYTDDFAMDVAVSGNYAYIANSESGLSIINVANPSSPYLIGTYDTPDEARAVEVSGNYAYVADWRSGLQIIDISNPYSPFLAGSYDEEWVFELSICEDLAHVVTGREVEIINISVPNSSYLVGSYITPGLSSDIAISGDNDYVADGNCGLIILKYGQCTITVTNPDGGESWNAGDSHNINWTSQNTSGSVDIQFSINNGGTWQTIVTNTEDDRIYSWTIPAALSDECLIKVCDTYNITCCDQSNGTFTITWTGDALIWSPVGSEYSSALALQNALIANGKEAAVSTDLADFTLNDIPYLFICLGMYPGNYVLGTGDPEVSQVVAHLTAGGRLYMEGGDTWAYDTQTSLHGMFKITGLSDGSDDLHTVLGATHLRDMDFTYSGTNSYIDKLEAQEEALVFHENDDPSYVCGIAYDHQDGAYRTIGTSFEFGGLDDESASSFTKTDLMARYLDFFDNGTDLCSLRVITPAGGEGWCAGESHDITWSSEFASGTVKIDYSTDGGSNWLPVIATTPDDGSHSWTIPNTPSVNCLVRICDAENETCCDLNDSALKISGCGPLAIVTDTLPDGFEGLGYEETIHAEGGILPYVWSVISGSLPPGLDLESSSGTITGTPDSIDTFCFTVRVEDDAGVADTTDLCITIDEYTGMKADANIDGVINILDALLTVNIVLEIVDPTPQQFWCTDCNGPLGNCDGDGDVNVVDAIKIVNIILGVDTCP